MMAYLLAMQGNAPRRAARERKKAEKVRLLLSSANQPWKCRLPPSSTRMMVMMMMFCVMMVV
jgi:hypothetical protein